MTSRKQARSGADTKVADEMAARVREALRADTRTSQYADTIEIETRDGIVILRGMIYDQVDNQNLLEVASRLAGVVAVADRLEIPMLELEIGA